MAVVTMTIQEALAKKKILENRINKALISDPRISRPKFVNFVTDVDTTMDGLSIDQATEKMKSEFESIKHLISNLSKLKVAINHSNSLTTIDISGKIYTVADAIARHRNISTEMSFYNECATQYADTLLNIKNINLRINDPENVSNYVNKVLGSDTAKRNEDLYKTIVEDYKKKNLVHIVDPNGFSEILDHWKEEIETFESEIHNALVASNVKTTISVEFED